MIKSIAPWVVAIAALTGCQGRPTGTGDAEYVDEQWQEQVDTYNRQTEQMDKILAQQEAEMERMTKQADRVDKLLTKQEEQAKRWDAILDAEENRVGIKP